MEKFIKDFSLLFEDLQISEFEANTRFRDLENWDSMAALTIMAMVDEKYKVKISPSELKNANTIKDLFDLVQTKRI